LNYFIAAILFVITLYTLGFAITLWKDKQKFGALATICLCILIIVLPFFSIYK